MNIRKAEEKDIPRLLALLGQVLQIHASTPVSQLSMHAMIICILIAVLYGFK